jgi:hypothetical protein
MSMVLVFFSALQPWLSMRRYGGKPAKDHTTMVSEAELAFIHSTNLHFLSEF